MPPIDFSTSNDKFLSVDVVIYFVFNRWNNFVYFSTFVIVVEFIVGNNAVIPDLFVLIDHAIRALILEVFIMAGVLNRCFDF